MEIYMIYFLKVITLQSILFGLYWFLNRKSVGFQFNRYFLIGTLILPFLIPLLNIPISIFRSEISSESAFDPWYFIEQSLPIVTIDGNQSLGSDSAWWVFLLLVLYLIVAIPSAFKMMYDYYKINQLGKTSDKTEYTPRGFQLLYVPTKILSFSFLNRIFLSNLFPLKSNEKNTIITHEEYHLAQLHSLDIILAEVVRIICWFNPIVLLIQKQLKETHEYLADRHTILHFGKNDYARLLKSFKWQEINMMLGNGYSSASIKNRIQMIELANKKSPIIQTLILSIISLFMAFLFACEENLDSFENKDNSFHYEFSEADLEKEINENVKKLGNAPQNLIDKYVTEQQKHPEYIYMPHITFVKEKESLNFSPENIKKSFKTHGNLDFEFEFFRMLNNEETGRFYEADIIAKFNIVSSYAVIHKVDRLKYMEYSYKADHEDVSIHDDYDKMAQFQGGMEALTEHLKNNLKYPEIAKEKGIEDRLVMCFIVTKHGGLIHLNIDQEPATMDDEVNLEFQKAAYYALRETEGKWQPAEKDGRFVMSKMTLPIEFKLDEQTLDK